MQGSKVASITIISLLLILSNILAFEQKDGSSSALLLSSGISIIGDENLTSENGVTRGSGTRTDPYVIEDLTIMTSDAYAMNIYETTKHLIIENCTLKGDGTNEGIDLGEVKNVSIVNCDLDRFNIGLRMYHPSNTRISESDISNCGYLSIYLWGGQDNISMRSLKKMNSINIFDSEDINVVDCNLSGGLNIVRVDNVTISDTEARGGFHIYSEGPGGSDIRMVGRNTVRGDEVWFANGGPVGPAPPDGIGEILFLNVSSSSFNNISDRTIPYVTFLYCSNLSITGSCFNGTDLGFIFCVDTVMDGCSLLSSNVWIDSCHDLTVSRCMLDDGFFFSRNSDHVRLCNSTFRRDLSDQLARYVQFTNCKDSTVLNVTARSVQGYLTIELDSCSRLSIDNCSFYHAFLNLIQTTETTIINNSMVLSSMDLSRSNDNLIMANRFNGSEYTALHIYYSNGNDVHQNEFAHSVVGISLEGFCPTDIAHCWFVENGIGVRLSSGGGGCSIYDNHFDNDRDIYPDIPAAYPVWSKSIVGKVNIVQGPNSGGNYWKDYTGTDTDYDGIGDTGIPFGPGDDMPLIDLRGFLRIDDLTEGTPVTGDPFDIRFDCDPIHPWVSTHYDLNARFFDPEGLLIEDVLLSGPVSYNGMVEVIANVPDGPSKMTYFIKVEDGYGKNASFTRTVPVKDGNLPSIELLDRSPFLTGEEAWARFKVTDNIGIDRVNVTIASNYKENISYPSRLAREADLWNASFPIDGACDRVMFFLNATDRNGLSKEEIFLWIPVSDIISPTLELLSPRSAARGESYTLRFRAADNIGIRGIDVEQVVDGKRTELLCEKVGGQEYASVSWIFELQEGTYFDVMVEDIAGNFKEEDWAVVLGPFNEPLFELDPGDPTTGDRNIISLTLSRPGISVYDAVCSFDAGPTQELTFPSSNEVMVPIDGRTMNISFELRDLGGYFERYEYSYEVTDNDRPTISVKHSEPGCGEEFWIEIINSDNIGVRDHGVVFDAGDTPLEVREGYDGNTSFTIPKDSTRLNVWIWATDLQRNLIQKNLSLAVADRIPPEIVEVRSWLDAGIISVSVVVEDNLGVEGVDCGLISPSLSGRTAMELRNGRFVSAIALPEGVSNFTFSIVVTDKAGNSVGSDGLWVEVPVPRPVPDPEPSGMSTVTIIVLTLLVAIPVLVTSMFFLYRKRRTGRFEE